MYWRIHVDRPGGARDIAPIRQALQEFASPYWRELTRARVSVAFRRRALVRGAYCRGFSWPLASAWLTGHLEILFNP